MVSLKERLGVRLKRDRAQSSVSNRRADTSVLLPFDVTRDYLESHALVRAMCLDAKDVFTALLNIEHVERSHESTRTTAPTTAFVNAVTAPPPRRCCIECASYDVTTNAREGHDVCESCGLVQTRMTINIVPEYTGPTTDEERARRDPFRIGHNIPRWLVVKNAAPLKKKAESVSYLNELEHWNIYVNLSYQDLRACNALLCAWGSGGFPRTIRIAAALLRSQVHIPREGELRTLIRDGARMNVVKDPVPAPAFKCSKCGMQTHTFKDARFHCFAGTNKRARLL